MTFIISRDNTSHLCFSNVDYLGSWDSTINKDTSLEKYKQTTMTKTRKPKKKKWNLANHHDIHKNTLFQKILTPKSQQTDKDAPHKISRAQMPFHKFKFYNTLTISQSTQKSFISIKSFNNDPNIYPTQWKKFLSMPMKYNTQRKNFLPCLWNIIPKGIISFHTHEKWAYPILSTY